MGCSGFWLLLLSAAAFPAEGRYEKLLRGVSYGPVPLKSSMGAWQLPQDDWMTADAKPMWGPRGRDDLQVIKSLGANFVRLYGNNPRNDHTDFLNEAYTHGIRVAPGVSDWPYLQNPSRVRPTMPCKFTNNYCYEQVKPHYLLNLKNGFLLPNHRYHPALAYVNVLNEPDLKMPQNTNWGSWEGAREMAKAVISAFDAMLDAEKEAGVVGHGINFTASFSYAVCKSCVHSHGSPALGQMRELQDAMYNPQRYGYTPRNNLAEAYRTRWTHSFNTHNSANDLHAQFLSRYEREFPRIPVFIAEYHGLGANQIADLTTILDLAEHSSIFLGISYFQYQQAYVKGGSEMVYGMFSLGGLSVESMDYFGKKFKIFCLNPVYDQPSNMALPEALAKAYGGSYVAADNLCRPKPKSVPLDGKGFGEISRHGSPLEMAILVNRALQHVGGFTVDENGMAAFAAEYVNQPEKAWGTMVGFLVRKPAWAFLDPAARCVADRDAEAQTVQEAIDKICSRRSFKCREPPRECQGNVFSNADWVFSSFYPSIGNPNPLSDCSFKGAGIYASAAYYSQWSPGCVVGQAGAPAARPAVPFTPMHPQWQQLRSSWGDIMLTIADSGSYLGVAPIAPQSPEVAMAEAQAEKGHRSLWTWVIFWAFLLAVTCFGAYGSRQYRNNKASMDRMWKTEWFKCRGHKPFKEEAEEDFSSSSEVMI